MRVERSWNRWKAIPPVHAYFGGEGTALGEHRQPVAARSVLVRQRSYRPRLMLQCLSTPVLATKRDRSSTPADRGSQGRGRAARDARSAVVPARRGTVMESDDLIAAAPAPSMRLVGKSSNQSEQSRPNLLPWHRSQMGRPSCCLMLAHHRDHPPRREVVTSGASWIAARLRHAHSASRWMPVRRSCRDKDSREDPRRRRRSLRTRLPQPSPLSMLLSNPTPLGACALDSWELCRRHAATVFRRLDQT